jgi:hypothetical protein
MANGPSQCSIAKLGRSFGEEASCRRVRATSAPGPATLIAPRRVRGMAPCSGGAASSPMARWPRRPVGSLFLHESKDVDIRQ